ncbi:aluminium induced protein with YGL and LRDR motifs [Striga asiatica]|uniref:Aluminium induced protein with YGL and LRDR motifs n=1 Tax=Striga asiatica TaxID=4170 RepID=A0A5A7R9V4_STRAF|nr:aluminium induced protein with YGL and LRDR motifs [Striga asiatica]
MLAVFKNGVINPPKELHSPASTAAYGKSKTPEETLKEFLASNSNNGFSLGFVDRAILAYVPPQSSVNVKPNQRLFCGVDDVYCIFMGSLNNLPNLNKRYGLSKGGNEALFVIEAYRTLRDRSPMPAHRVLKELEGSFGFVIYDHKYGIVFAALGSDKATNLFWGVASDGSVMISDDVCLIKASCIKSFAPFPNGCMYHSDRGLMSFEHPMHKMKAMPRINSEGAMCGSYFAVDAYSKVNSMPRVGSAANWATWE